MASNKRADNKSAKKGKSPFISYCITTVSCLLIVAITFAIVMFKTNTIFSTDIGDYNLHIATQANSIAYVTSTVKIEKEPTLPDIPDSLLAGLSPDPQGNNQTNPSGQGGGSSNYTPTILPASQYAQAIIDKMRAIGYNDYAISGALGNFVAESGLNPASTQDSAYFGKDNATVRAWQSGASGRAIGFAQWDGGRAINLLNAADAAGVEWYNFDFQLNFYLQELAGNNCSVDKFNAAATDTEHAAWWFVKKFERCGTCKYAPCSGASYGNISNGAHGHGDNAAYVDFEYREHINGWTHRVEGALNFYATYFN